MQNAAATMAAGSNGLPAITGAERRKVIFASSLGTFIFALLASPPAFVRPFGALVFGRLGDLVGRKYTFLVTILIMGLSTFVVGLLPATPRSASPRRSS
jgi:MFS family permease